MQYDDVITSSRRRTDAILKIVFGYILAPYWPINAKFGSEMKNHMPIQDAWPKLQFSKIQDADCRHFENSIIVISKYLSCELSDFDQIWYTDVDFHSEDELLSQNWNFANSRWRTDTILKIVFLAKSRRHVSSGTLNSSIPYNLGAISAN